MKILIMGAGKMGSFFIDLLSFEHEVAVYEKDAKRMRFTYNCQRFTQLDEIKAFAPELVINAVTVKYTLAAFKEVLPCLPAECIISDIASVKTGLKVFYEESGHPYVSTHPMFGPTFANLNQLSEENAIIISEAPGTTFKRHMQIAKGVLNEDDYLLQEILFNPYTGGQVVQIRQALKELIDIIDRKDATAMKDFLMRIRNHVKDDIV